MVAVPGELTNVLANEAVACWYCDTPTVRVHNALFPKAGARAVHRARESGACATRKQDRHEARHGREQHDCQGGVRELPRGRLHEDQVQDGQPTDVSDLVPCTLMEFDLIRKPEVRWRLLPRLLYARDARNAPARRTQASQRACQRRDADRAPRSLPHGVGVAVVVATVAVAAMGDVAALATLGILLEGVYGLADGRAAALVNAVPDALAYMCDSSRRRGSCYSFRCVTGARDEPGVCAVQYSTVQYCSSKLRIILCVVFRAKLAMRPLQGGVPTAPGTAATDGKAADSADSGRDSGVPHHPWEMRRNGGTIVQLLRDRDHSRSRCTGVRS